MFSACGNRGSDIELSRDSGDYNVVRVIENGNEHLIVTNQSELSSDLRYYINGKFVSNIDKKYTHRGSLLLDLDEVSEWDIGGEAKITDKVYSLDFYKSAGYVKQLINSGYNIEFEAYTPEYIEMYLSNNQDLKRVIFTQTYIIVTDVTEEFEFNINNYIYE